jgi:hypothetical protein
LLCRHPPDNDSSALFERAILLLAGVSLYLGLLVANVTIFSTPSWNCNLHSVFETESGIHI